MGIYIVFKDDRYSMKQTARSFFPPLTVKRPRSRQGVRVHFDDGFKPTVEFLDSIEVEPGYRFRGKLARLHFLLEASDRDFLQLERLRPSDRLCILGRRPALKTNSSSCDTTDEASPIDAVLFNHRRLMPPFLPESNEFEENTTRTT